MTNIGRMRALSLIAGLIWINGCGGPAAVLSGKVTYDGRPVENGTITFFPADGLGPVYGVPIQQGKYRVEIVKPAKTTVQIVGVKKVNFARSSDEMAQAAKEAFKRADSTGIIERADIIPADAEGNNQEVEIAAGTHEMNFALKPPSAKK